MNNKIIVGAMLVSRNADLLDITIPNLLKWCDWVLILMDNETPEVEYKVYKLQNENHSKMFVRRSSIAHKLFYRSGEEMNYRERWKGVKGIIRDEVFVNLRRILDLGMKKYNKIDLLLWPDSDEIFTDYLPELLEEFWNSNYKAISTKPVDVVGNMRTIKRESMAHHVHIMKYNRELAGLPRRFFAMYYPLCHSDLMKADYYSVHLALLNDKIIKWRQENWKIEDISKTKFYKLNEDIEHFSPSEIKLILKS
jgi:hypothetical protein